jgi:hypothetical protein
MVLVVVEEPEFMENTKTKQNKNNKKIKYYLCILLFDTLKYIKDILLITI